MTSQPIVDKSTNPTVVQYAVQYQFKNKSPAVAAKLTAEKLSGGTNMFLGHGVVQIDPKKLEEALWDNMVGVVLRSLKNIKPSMESIAVDGAADQFNLQGANVAQLHKRVVQHLGRPLDDSKNPFMKHAARRLAAHQFVAEQGDRPQLTLMHPQFNLREVAKQMILLEDHLCHPYKRCPDCIRKHLMTIEAFAEEAVSLDQVGVYRPTAENLAVCARIWLADFHDHKPLPEIAQKIRGVRKELVRLVADPRDSVSRVAARHLAATTLCVHQRPATIG